eukprot:gb/GFBE01034044.1/.p1 GENE.gb/GFBE01034044.1/~~gb/GFBE01034044.1/.p1  ORF type:complete len:372 (+),score=128.19 gb/GFBE01034044.1/:1-1116(+)
MTTPDLFTTVGFEKSKIGANDTELGYAIKKTRLIGLVIGGLGCLGFLALIGVWSQFEVHLERRSLHRQLRKEEHKAASKLAQVGMELWSEYRDDIHESHEAQLLVKQLNSSYDRFQATIRSSVQATSNELGLNQDKAAKLADTILHLVADQQKESLTHTKKLVDHLVEAGKRAVPLQKHAEHEVLKEVKEEGKAIAEDLANGVALPEADPVEPGAGENLTEPEDPLKGILDGFWYVFHDYEREFSGKPRELMKPGHKAFDALKAIADKEDELTEAEIAAELDKVDLESVGAGLGSGRVLPARDIVEELLMIGTIPHKELDALYEDWVSGKEDSVSVFAKLEEMHGKELVPSGWLQRGVDEDEKEEAERERD